MPRTKKEKTEKPSVVPVDDKALESKKIVADKAEKIEKTEEGEKKPATHHAPKKDKYYEATGRRKTAISRVRLYTKVKTLTVNNKPLDEYFKVARFQKAAFEPIEKMKIGDKLGAIVKVSGGGHMAQSEATRLAVARALIKFNPIFKKRLRKLGFLTRDSRAVERKKYGLKKARRAPQWKKR